MKVDPLAAYGAALSTIIFVWTVWRARRKIVVQIIPTVGERGGSSFGYTVVISNHSAVPVHVVEVSMHYDWRKVTLLERIGDAWRWRALRWRGWCGIALPKGSDKVTPFTLAPGQAQNIYIPEDGLIKAIGKARPKFGVYIMDGLMKRHYSRPETPMKALSADA